MVEIICQQCRHKNEEAPYPLSCAHKMCSECLARIVLSNNFSSIKDKESLTIYCKCKEGKVDIAYKDYLSYLHSYLDKKPGQCRVHKVTGTNFCEECQMWLCLKCREEFHDKCYESHHLVDVLVRKEKCKFHPTKEVELYCKSCLCEICYQCVANGEGHFGHKFMKYEDYMRVIKSNMAMNKYKSFEDFNSVYSGVVQRIKGEYEKDVNNINTQIDIIIEKLKNCKENYNKKMKSKFNRMNEAIEIVRLLYQIYFDDVSKRERNFAILKQIKKVNKEIVDIKYSPYSSDELSNILYDINNFEQFCGFNFEIVFKNSNSLPNKDPFISEEEMLNTNNKTALKTTKLKSQKKKTNIVKLMIKNEITIKDDVGELLCLIKLKNGLLVSSSTDTNIKFWDIKSKKQILTYTGHKKTINCLLELQDNRLASGSDDEIIIIWNLLKNKQEFQLIGHSAEILSLGELPNKNVVSGSWDNTIKIWNLEKQKEEATLVGHRGAVCALCPLFSGLLSSGSTDQTIKIWNCESYKEQTTLYGHTMTVFSLVQLSNGNLCSGSADKTIKVWDIAKEECLFTLTGSSNWIYSLAVINDELIVSGSKDQIFRIWNLESRSLVYSSTKQVGFVNSVIRLNGKLFATGIVNEIKLWSIKE